MVALAALTGLEFVREQLSHSAWEGVRYYDLIWPSFMLMVGVSVPFSFARRSLIQTPGEIRRDVWKRTVVLFLLGSLRESVATGVPTLIELSSALQPIALAYLVTAHLAGCSVRLQVGVAVAILAGYGLLLAFVPVPGVAPGTYEQNHNLVTAVDQIVLGRAHRDGWGTVLSAIPAIATTITGLLLGRVLMSTATPRVKAKIIGLTGLGCLAVGCTLSPVVPAIMKLWTVSYALQATGWACMLFLFFYWVVDGLGLRWWAFPLVVIGMNALGAYLLPTVMPLGRIVGIFTKPLASALGALGPAVSAGAVLLAGWLVLFWLYQRKIFLRP